jgi:hypothetical protein
MLKNVGNGRQSRCPPSIGGVVVGTIALLIDGSQGVHVEFVPRKFEPLLAIVLRQGRVAGGRGGVVVIVVASVPVHAGTFSNESPLGNEVNKLSNAYV